MFISDQAYKHAYSVWVTKSNLLHDLLRYYSAVINSDRSVKELLLAYGPQPSFDDMAWYGLAYARIFETTGLVKFLELSSKIFNWVWEQGWDTDVCGGGVWFDQVVANYHNV